MKREKNSGIWDFEHGMRSEGGGQDLILELDGGTTSTMCVGMEMDQLICEGCRTLLMYTRVATSVRCSCCHTVNVAPVRFYTASSSSIAFLIIKMLILGENVSNLKVTNSSFRLSNFISFNRFSDII